MVSFYGSFFRWLERRIREWKPTRDYIKSWCKGTEWIPPSTLPKKCKCYYQNGNLYNLLLYHVFRCSYAVMKDCWDAKPLARPTFTNLVHRIGVMLEDSVRKVNKIRYSFILSKLVWAVFDVLLLNIFPTFDLLIGMIFIF